jgi:hypothetical protein
MLNMMAKKAKLKWCKPNEPQLESMRENFHGDQETQINNTWEEFQDMTTQGPCKVITTHMFVKRHLHQYLSLSPLMKVNHHLTKGKVVQRRSLMVKRNVF